MKRTLVFALAWLPVGCGGSAAERPTLFAAASLREAVEEVCELYASEGNTRPRLNIAASNLLARQILAGGRADLFFSADELQVDQVDAAGLVAQRRSLLSNRLAVIYPEGIEYPTMLVEGNPPGPYPLCVANEAVPVGRYTHEWLRNRGNDLIEYPRIVEAVSARGVLAAVESGAVSVGIVYVTDAAISDKVSVAFVVDDESAPNISYSLALIAGANASGEGLFEFLSGPTAAEVFRRHGFLWRGPD